MTDERIKPHKGNAADIPKEVESLPPVWFRWQWLRRSAAYAESLNQLYRCEPGNDVLPAFCNAFALEYGEPPHPDDSEGWRKLECNDESWQRLQDDAGRFVQTVGDTAHFVIPIPNGFVDAKVCDQIIAQVQALKDQLEGKRKRGRSSGSFGRDAMAKALEFSDLGMFVERGRGRYDYEWHEEDRAKKIIESEIEHIERQAKMWQSTLAQFPNTP